MCVECIVNLKCVVEGKRQNCLSQHWLAIVVHQCAGSYIPDLLLLAKAIEQMLFPLVVKVTVFKTLLEGQVQNLEECIIC